jgi:hypothetical protein
MKLQGPGKPGSAIHTAGHGLRPLSRPTTIRPAMRSQAGGSEHGLRSTSRMATDLSRRLWFDPADPSRSPWRGPPVNEADRSPPSDRTRCPLDLAGPRR